jgi:hypothetical protein
MSGLEPETSIVSASPHKEMTRSTAIQGPEGTLKGFRRWKPSLGVPMAFWRGTGPLTITLECGSWESRRVGNELVFRRMETLSKQHGELFWSYRPTEVISLRLVTVMSP